MGQADSLKVEQNADGTFTVEWDKNDPNWSWMNNHTSKEIQDLVQEAVKLGLDNAIPDYTELPDDKQSQRKPLSS